MESLDDEETKAPENWTTLVSLPPEILLHIFSFLSSKYVITVLSKVCKHFEAIISNDTTWRVRIFERWPKKYPIIPSVLPLIDWKIACIEREEQYRMWHGDNHLQNLRKYHFPEAHYGCVNVIQLIENGKIAASGGRDGYLKLWNFEPASLKHKFHNSEFYFVDDPVSCLISSSHHANAWLWTLAYGKFKKHLFSGGFDCNIKAWDLENASCPLVVYNLASPVLCLDHCENVLAAGSFGRNVNCFDLRLEKKSPVLSHNQHKKSVLCIAVDNRYIISGSEDKSVIVFDIVGGKVIQTLQFEYFPLSMSYGQGQLFVGDVNNSLHVIDPTDGQFVHLYTFNTGHKQKVTGVQHSLGSIITCSTDQTINILEPNVDPEIITTLHSSNEVTSISFCNNILACANVDDSISVWIPCDFF